MQPSGAVFDSQEFRMPLGTPTARSIEYRIDKERWTVTVTLAGDITVDALTAVRDRIIADGAYSPGMNICVECRVMTALPTDAEIRAMALRVVFNRALGFHGRVAIVAMTARSYEAASLFELYLDPGADRLAVFTDPVQARAWLGLSR